MINADQRNEKTGSFMRGEQFGLLGFGEAGQAIAASLLKDYDVTISAFDHAIITDEDRAAQQQQTGVIMCTTPDELATSAELIISVVTADEAVLAAQSIAPFLSDSHIFMDGNSVSPGTKHLAAEALHSHNVAARYIDLAIMAPIHPAGHRTSLLIAGPEQARLAPLLDRYGFVYEWEGAEPGQACIVKMLRSVLIKGVESLICESVTASQALGLDTRILASAGKTLGMADMPGLADYFMERTAVHAKRRAAEMREVAKTLEELGLSHYLPTATALHQDMIAEMDISSQFEGAVPQDRTVLAPAMRAGQTRKG